MKNLEFEPLTPEQVEYYEKYPERYVWNFLCFAADKDIEEINKLSDEELELQVKNWLQEEENKRLQNEQHHQNQKTSFWRKLFGY